MTIACALAVPTAAQAGGWATAGLTPLPDGIAPGATWKAEITLLQHAVRPLAGVHPVLILREGSRELRFPATATPKLGVYAVTARFPAAGRWIYSVDDGFGRVHRLGRVDVGGGGATSAVGGAAQAGPPADDGGPSPLPALIAMAAAALLFAGAWGVVLVRGRVQRGRGPALGA